MSIPRAPASLAPLASAAKALTFPSLSSTGTADTLRLINP